MLIWGEIVLRKYVSKTSFVMIFLNILRIFIKRQPKISWFSPAVWCFLGHPSGTKKWQNSLSATVAVKPFIYAFSEHGPEIGTLWNFWEALNAKEGLDWCLPHFDVSCSCPGGVRSKTFWEQIPCHSGHPGACFSVRMVLGWSFAAAAAAEQLVP